jgi:predicted class III extradiol MEMO1 family dioxygenase
MDQERRSTLQASDRDLIEIINDGDAERFYFQVAADGDQNRICGFSSIYLMLRYLGPVIGTQIAYDQCPADEKDHSFVSICGLLLK